MPGVVCTTNDASHQPGDAAPLGHTSMCCDFASGNCSRSDGDVQGAQPTCPGDRPCLGPQLDEVVVLHDPLGRAAYHDTSAGASLFVDSVDLKRDVGAADQL